MIRCSLRPAVIQRKVTNGYRAMWAAEYETAVRSTVAPCGRRFIPDHASNINWF
jgi:hypothetical protein